MSPENVAKTFANWLSANYEPDNGIGFWTSFDPTETDKSFSTNELWKIFIDGNHFENPLYSYIAVDEEMKKIMDEYLEEENRRIEEESYHNDRVLQDLKEKLGEGYVSEILECLEDSEAHGKLEIVDKPDIKPQEEDWGHFDHVLVDQYENGGYSGDDFAGYIYIPINDGKYLKSHYSM